MIDLTQRPYLVADQREHIADCIPALTDILAHRLVLSAVVFQQMCMITLEEYAEKNTADDRRQNGGCYTRPETCGCEG